jgi:hypothetical protein
MDTPAWAIGQHSPELLRQSSMTPENREKIIAPYEISERL